MKQLKKDKKKGKKEQDEQHISAW